MAEIRAIYYDHEPNFPASDQHPDATRYYYWIGEPSAEDCQVEIQARGGN